MLHSFKQILTRKAEVCPPHVLQWTGLAQKKKLTLGRFSTSIQYKKHFISILVLWLFGFFSLLCLISKEKLKKSILAKQWNSRGKNPQNQIAPQLLLKLGRWFFLNRSLFLSSCIYLVGVPWISAAGKFSLTFWYFKSLLSSSLFTIYCLCVSLVLLLSDTLGHLLKSHMLKKMQFKFHCLNK